MDESTIEAQVIGLIAEEVYEHGEERISGKFLEEAKQREGFKGLKFVTVEGEHQIAVVALYRVPVGA